MKFNWHDSYSSRRSPVFSNNIIATSQPLAAMAGISRIARGGNAVDAAIAAAICLTVVEPTNNGVGGDCFALVYQEGELTAINGSGPSPQDLNLAAYSSFKKMPIHGWLAVTIPGQVNAWLSLSQRFGRLPFAELFEPAIHYAQTGYAVTPVVAEQWQRAKQAYQQYPEFCRYFFPHSNFPKPGDIFQHADLANTLQLIAETDTKAFYQGELTEKIIKHAKTENVMLCAEDFTSHKALIQQAITVNYLDYTLCECQPNGQGLVTLIAAGILQHCDHSLLMQKNVDYYHYQIEAMRLALQVAATHLGDPQFMTVPSENLLQSEFLRSLANKIQHNKTSGISEHPLADFGTVYLSVGDENGMMVSLIQSNFMGFGSGILIPETGITMNNRGACFNLRSDHPNSLQAGKYPYHTIMPGFVMKDNKPFMSFGVVGGPFQPQGQLQILLAILNLQLNPQSALDMPRWFLQPDGNVDVEQGFDETIIAGLENRGHVVRSKPQFSFGGAQLIIRINDSYIGASDPRRDGLTLGY